MVLRGDSWLGLGVTPSSVLEVPCDPGNFIQVSCVQAKCTLSPLGYLLLSLSNTVEFLGLVEETDAQRLSSLPPALSTLRSHRTIKHGTKKSHSGRPSLGPDETHQLQNKKQYGNLANAYFNFR